MDNFIFPETTANIAIPECKPPKFYKYPEYILKKLRQRIDLDEDDTSQDEELDNLAPNKVFSEVLKWDGLLGNYDAYIKSWIKDIYGVDLNKINMNKEM